MLVGTDMGTNVAVIYAILVMANLERKLYIRVDDMYPANHAEYIIKTGGDLLMTVFQFGTVSTILENSMMC